MNFENVMQTAILIIVAALGIVLGFKIWKPGTKYLHFKLSAEKWVLLEKKAAMIVRALNQSPQFANYESSQKKEYGLIYLASAAEKMSFSITRSELDFMLDAAISDARKENIATLSATDVQ